MCAAAPIASHCLVFHVTVFLFPHGFDFTSCFSARVSTIGPAALSFSCKALVIALQVHGFQAQLSAEILSLKAELQATREEIARLHSRCRRLEKDVARGLVWLSTLHSQLQRVDFALQLLKSQARAVYSQLQEVLSAFLHTIQVWI